MANSRRLTERRANQPPRAILALEPLTARIADDVPRWHGADVEPDLVRARLADRYRDAQLRPAPPDVFDRLVEGLDAEAWRRLALVVSALDADELRAALPALLAQPAEDQMRHAFIDFARATELLTLELLGQGPLRIEEFARSWLDRLGAEIEGESAAQSRERLERLDYRRLLAEAEKARQDAEERMERLRTLQEQAGRRARRGKW